MPSGLSGSASSSLALTAQFSDNAHTSGESYMASVNWGDGSTTSATPSTTSTQGNTLQGSVQASHSYMIAGTFTVTLSVSGMGMGGGGSGSGTTNATVTAGTPQPPVVTSPGAQTSAEGALVSLQVSARDPNGYPLTYAASGLPAGLNCGSGGLISGTVSYSAAETNGGSYNVTVTATDSHGASGTATFAWTVADTVRSPVLTNPGTQQGAEGQAVSLQVSATDPDGYALSYQASGLPSGLAISSSGLISGAIAYSAAETSGGSYNVTVTATDTRGASSSQSFAWTVTNTDRPPAVTNPGSQSSAEGATVGLQTSASDPDASEGDTLTYAAAGLPAGLGISAQTGLVSGTISYSAAETNGGNYSTTVTATDSHGASSSQTFTWTVTHTIQAPSVTNPGNQNNAEGDQVSLQVSATDPAGNPLTYSATGLPAGLSIASATGVISGTVSYSAAETSGGSYPVTVTATDSQGASGSQTFSWAVTNTDRPPVVTNPGNQTGAEGSQVSLQVSASDPDASEGDTQTYAAAGLPAGLAISAQTGLISGTVSYSAAETNGGSYSVTVTATDSHGTSSSQTFTWTVTDTNRPPAVTNPGSQSSAEGDQVNLQVTATDPDASEGDTLSYAAAGLPAGLAISAQTGLISGTVAYGDAATGGGNYSVTVTATDSHGASSSQTFAWTVAHTNQAPSITNPGNQSNHEGDAVSLQVQASDPDGDTLTYSATGLPDGLNVNTSTGLISGTIRPGAGADGPLTTTVSASDATDTTAQTFTWNVSSPVTVTSPGDRSNAEGDTVSLQVQASDLTGGTLSYSANYLPAGLAIDPVTGLVSGTIAAGAAADSPLTTTVTAGDGTYSDSQTFTWNVSTPVTIAAPGDQSSAEGDAVSLQLHATDASGGSLTYAATGLPDGLAIDPSSGLISGTIAASASGPDLVVVTAGDGSAEAQVTFTWNVGSPVAVTNPGDQSSREGQTASLQIQASDAGGGTLAYSATGLPDGLAIDPSTGLISGIISPGAAADGPFITTITAGDGTYADTQTFTWDVGSRVAVTNPGDQSNAQGDVVSVQVQASDAAGSSLTYSATGLPAGLAIDPNTGLISGTFGTGGSYQATVTATDGTARDSQAFTWDVSSPVTLLAPGDQASQEGDVIALPMSASDASGGALTYAATGLPPGLGIDPGSGLISGTIPAGAAADGPFVATVTASDGTWSSQQTFTWDISSPITITSPGDQANTEGDAVSLQVQASDPTGGTLTYGATQLPAGLAIDAKTGLISGTIRPGAAAAGPFASTVTATDGTYTAGAAFTWDITSPVAITSPSLQANVEGDAVALQVQATDATGGTLTYATTGLPAGLGIDSGSGLISGIVSPGVAADSPFTTTVTATDGTYTGSQTFQWTVSLPVTIASPADQANVEGDTVALQVQASDPTGGGLTYDAAGLPDGLTIDASTGLISGTISAGAAADGPFDTTVTASDGPSSAQATFTWNVTSPVAVTSPGDQSNVEGDTVSLQLQASDFTGGTLAYSADGLPDGLSIDPNSGLIAGTISAGAADDGPFDTTVTATDGTYSAQQSFNWDVSTPPAAQDIGDAGDNGSDGTAAPTGPVAVTNPGTQVSTDGDTLSLQVQASDSSGGTLTYSATGLPAGLSIDPNTGLISGTVSAGTAGSSVFSSTVTASDGSGSSQQTFAWVVTSSPGSTSGALTETLTADDLGGSAGETAAAQTPVDTADGAPSLASTGLLAGSSPDVSSGPSAGALLSAAGAALNAGASTPSDAPAAAGTNATPETTTSPPPGTASSPATTTPAVPAAVMPPSFAGNAGDPGALLGTSAPASAPASGATATQPASAPAGGPAAVQPGSVATHVQVTSGGYHRHYTLSGDSSTGAFYLDVTIDSTFSPGGSAGPTEAGTVTYTAWQTEMGLTVLDDEDVTVPFSEPTYGGPDYFGLPIGGGPAAGYDLGSLGIGGDAWDHERWDDALTFRAGGTFVDGYGATEQFAGRYDSTSWWQQDDTWTAGAAPGAGTDVSTYREGGHYTSDVTTSDVAANLPTGTAAADASGYPSDLSAAPASGSTALARSFDTQTYGGNSTITTTRTGPEDPVTTTTVAHSEYSGSDAYRSYYNGAVPDPGAGSGGSDARTVFADFQATGTYGGSQDTDVIGTAQAPRAGTVTTRSSRSATVQADTYNTTDTFSLDAAGAHLQDTYQSRSSLDGPATYSDRETLQQVYGSGGRLTTDALTYRTEVNAGNRVSSSDQGSFRGTAPGQGGAVVGRSGGSWNSSTGSTAHARVVSSGTQNLLNQTGSVNNSTESHGSSTALSLATATTSAADGSYSVSLTTLEIRGSNFSDTYRAQGNYSTAGQQTSGTSFLHAQSGAWNVDASHGVQEQRNAPEQTTDVNGSGTSSTNLTADLSYASGGQASGSVRGASSTTADQNWLVTTKGPLQVGGGSGTADDRDHRKTHATDTTDVNLDLAAGRATGAVTATSDIKVDYDYTLDHTVDLTAPQTHATIHREGSGFVQSTDTVATALTAGRSSTTRTLVVQQKGTSNGNVTADGLLADTAGHSGNWNLTSSKTASMDDTLKLSFRPDASGWSETSRWLKTDDSDGSDTTYHEGDNGLNAPAATPGVTETDVHTLDAKASTKDWKRMEGTPDSYRLDQSTQINSKSEDFRSHTWSQPSTGESGRFIHDSITRINLADTLGEYIDAGQVTHFDLGRDDRISHYDRTESSYDSPRLEWNLVSWKDPSYWLKRSFDSDIGGDGFLKLYGDAYYLATYRDKTAWLSGIRGVSTVGKGHYDLPGLDRDLSASPFPSRQPPATYLGLLSQDIAAVVTDPAFADVLRIATGTIELIGGVTIIVTTDGLGILPGGGLIAVGADQILTGVANLYTGQRSMSAFEYAGYSGARWVGFDEQTSQVIGALTPAALSLVFGAWGGLLQGATAGAAGAGSAEAGAADQTGWSIFGLNAPPPTGPISAALQDQMIAAAQSPWFRLKANVWAWLVGRGPINWTDFMSRLSAAEFREYATWQEALRSVGWAGRAGEGSEQWLFGVSGLGRNVPILGRSMMQHELFHALQDLKYGAFALESNTSVGQWLAIELAAHAFGGPFAGGTLIGVAISPGVTIYILARQ